jgi:hypothetical protein
MKSDIEMGIVHPHGPPLIRRNPGELLSEPRNEVKPTLEMLVELFFGNPRILKDCERADVHVSDRRLGVKKPGILSGKPFVFSHGPSV